MVKPINEKSVLNDDIPVIENVVSEETTNIIKNIENDSDNENLYKFCKLSQLMDGVEEDSLNEVFGNFNKLWVKYPEFITYQDEKFYITEKGLFYLKNKGYLKKSKEDLKREKSMRIINEGFAVVDIEGRIIKINRNMVVDYILENKPHIFTMADTEEIYLYQNGVYKIWRESEVKDYINDLVGNLATRFEQGEIINQLKYIKVINREKINCDENILNFKNGLYNLEKNEFLEHNPKEISIIQFPVEYNPKATCPKIEKFLDDILEKQEDKDGIYELIGYLLVSNYKHQKAWMLNGEGSNGKSTLLNLIENVLGDANCSHIPLQQLTGGGFYGAELYGKLANIYADLNEKALYQTGYFKQLTGGDTIHAQKKFLPLFSFRSYARLIFSCNRIPFSNDDTSAFFRRWIIIQFNKIIDKPDKNLLEKLTTKEELSGLLNICLEALKRLETNKCFSNEGDVKQLTENYQKLSDPAYAYFSDRLIPEPEDYVLCSVLSTSFIDYCMQNKLPIRSNNYLYKRLPNFCPCYKKVKLVEGKSENVIIGLKIKGDEDE